MIQDTDKFKLSREEQFGGRIHFMTYASFIGKASSGKVLKVGGIIFAINETLHFEDFEKTPALMGIMTQRSDYIKTEFSIDLDEISIVKEIKEKDALQCINGTMDENEILPAPNGFASLFSTRVIQVITENEPSLFFDFLNKEGFINLINEYMLKTE
jgi:hypothetical protein